jgi:uncharacterized protein YrrD
MTQPVSWLVIDPGWHVYAQAGEEVGRVEEVVGEPEEDIFSGLLVATGFFSARFVPAEHVRSITENRVDLALSAQEVDALTDRPPAGAA